MFLLVYVSLSTVINRFYFSSLWNKNLATKILHISLPAGVCIITSYRTMDVTISLVFFVAAVGLFVKLEAAPKVDKEDSCIVSLIIPQEKIKSSCDDKGMTEMKMQSIVREISEVQRNIGELNVRLTKILSRDDNNEEIKELSERVLSLENVKIPNLESRVTAIEEERKNGAPFTIPRKRLVRMLKPVLKKEINEIKKQLIAEVTKEIMRSPDIGSKSFDGREPSEITSEILFNQVKSHSGKQQQLYAPQNLKSYTEVASSVTDIPDTRFSKSFNKHLESLSRKFKYESVQSAMNNELPEKYTHPNLFQSDSQFDPRMDRLIEIFKNELTENLDKQTEKVKAITNRHLNEVEGKMSQILNIIEGIQAKYDNKLSEIAKGHHHKHNTSSKLEHLETDIKTLAAGISALRSNFFADPQFQQLFKQELLTMENKISGKFFEHTEPLRQEIIYFSDQLSKSKTEQILTRSTFQNYRADLRVQLHYMEQDISVLKDQFAVINSTLLYPDYPEVDMEHADRELKISQTLYFFDNIKHEWPNVLSNLSHLVDVHVNDMDTIKTDFTDAQQKYDQLKESQRELLEQISAIENRMENFKDSLSEVERFTLNGALEANKWIAFDFKHTYGRTGCFGGKKYVKRTGYKTGVFVGVVLCSATRYKIYLSDSLNDTFLDIGDAENLGEDHCEFVGANKTSVINVEKTTHIKMERLSGYFRHRWGQTPTKGNITFFWPTPYWYECGVRIPE